MYRLGLSVCVVLVVTYSTAFALKCYKCEKCNDPFNKEGVETEPCETGPCMKIKSLGDSDMYKKNDVLRFCSTKKKDVGCHSEEVDTRPANITVHVCYCDKDLCNGSDVIKSYTTAGILAVVAIILKTLL